MTPHALLFTLAAIGISETAYLIRKRLIEKKRPTCLIGEECHQVLESRFNKTIGIPNEILGITFFVVMSLITAFLVIKVEPIIWWDNLLKILIFGGVLLSLYFTYLQWRVIKAWCFWCLMSAVTIFLMAIIVITSNLTIVL